MFGLFTKRRSGPADQIEPEAQQEQDVRTAIPMPAEPALWHAPLPELARKLPSSSWLRAEDTGAACVCCSTPDAGMIFDTSPLCITCASVLSFDREGLDERVEPIWLPFISQAALNRVMGAHLRACRAGPAEAPSERRQADDAEPGKEQFAYLLQEARRAAQSRLGDVSASDLVAAWRGLTPDAVEAQTAIRFLPKGVWQNQFDRNVFTEFLTHAAPGGITP
ncbi:MULTISPECIES: hypothetical protein [Asaia]|uniref:Uncharacterized protein n=1 Tax=Asaia bogorensis TaxID=91915 RepID=A0A060QJ73_9PROT|nr:MULTISPECIES: hypothetical protein [Asaia]ETC99447.1 hypothetical protein P792_03110 [Asaia sp. SF2.1]CDG41015.1 hypothetical protein ASAP_2970 [Asaia bogorensis]